jgi:uncharacterized protein YacL
MTRAEYRSQNRPSGDDQFAQMITVDRTERVPRFPADVFVEVVRVLLIAMATAIGDSAWGGPGAGLGACCGYVLGGVVGRRLRVGAGRFEQRVDGLPAVTMAAGAIGALTLASVGLIGGIAAVVLLPGRWGWPVLGLGAWTGLYAGFQVGARKGDELLSVLRRSPVPDETVRLRITRPGTEAGQGVGFLDDGSMVVVAGGADRRGELVEAVVTSSTPTTKGRLYFATLLR